MRTILLASLALFATVAPAAADELAPLGVKPLAGDACAQLGANAKTCKKAASLAVKGLGTATLYRVSTAGSVAFAIALEVDGKPALSEPLTQNTEDCGAGKCDDLVKATPALKAIRVGGQPAVALDLTVARARSYNEGGRKPRRYTVHELAVCGRAGGGVACQQVSFGSLDEPCTATLSATGEVRSRCDKTTTFYLR